MPAIVVYAQHSRTHRTTCTDVVESLLRPCSIRPTAWRGHKKHSKRNHTFRKPSCVTSQQGQLGNKQKVPASHDVRSCPPEYQIRRARLDEVDQVADLNAEAFAWLASKDMNPGLLKRYTEQAERFYEQSIYQDSSNQLKRALHEKQQAARGAREATLRRQSRKLRADIARLQGQPAPALPLEDRLQRVAVQSWRRKRQFMCLVAEQRSSKQLVASCILSLAAPDAFLPAPFPTTKPWRLYCSNMAVAPTHRRKGLATSLLQHCQRLGALWDHQEIWLHVDVINQQAQELYMGSGFAIRSQDSWYYILGRKRYLMQKALPERQSRASNNEMTGAGGSLRSDGVFVWNVQPDVDSSTKVVQTNSSDTDA
ncbi:hypothetical protein ABBQ38_013183 [Trebouxia sp. C0009 RCD-2024]